MADPMVFEADVSVLPLRVLYGVLRLRAEVFVLEQDCPFVDPDGRDLEPNARHLWIEDDDGEVIACARVLAEPDGSFQIGRVVTAMPRRHEGLAGAIVQRALDLSGRPVWIKAQARLADWYAAFGFVISGDEFMEDGIPHVPMILTSS
jgi:ElaA protein